MWVISFCVGSVVWVVKVVFACVELGKFCLLCRRVVLFCMCLECWSGDRVLGAFERVGVACVGVPACALARFCGEV